MTQLLENLKFLGNDDVNVLHGDLKPDNIIVINKESGSVRLVDFGLAYKTGDVQVSNFKLSVSCSVKIVMSRRRPLSR